MKPFISLMIIAICLSGCAVDNEQDKLCKFMHTCDSGESDDGMQRLTDAPHE